jgi:hypothetical protein
MLSSCHDTPNIIMILCDAWNTKVLEQRRRIPSFGSSTVEKKCFEMHKTLQLHRRLPQAASIHFHISLVVHRQKHCKREI